ncbi:MAG: hypothetical protein JRI44_00470 [Deltaproteobacteria bacterium]|nr:hypothetical protein [Deltaproteobacteria bacterium]
MKHKLIILLFILFPFFILTSLVSAASDVYVVSTYPKLNQNDVSYMLDKIQVTFNVPMKTNSYSFVVAGPGETPEITGNPWFKDEYTCILPVKLKPDKLYSIGINSQRHKGFRSKDGIPAIPFVLIFRTVSTTPPKNLPLPRKTSFGASTRENRLQSISRSTNVFNKPTIQRATIPKIVIYKLYFDRTEGAFWVLIPSGWGYKGGVVRKLFQVPRFNFEVYHPNGWGYYRYIPTPRYLPPLPFRPAGSIDEYGNVYLPLMSPVNYLTQVVVPQLYKNSSAKILGSKELPQVVQSFRNFYQLIGLTVSQFQAASITLDIIENQSHYIDRLITIMLIYQMPQLNSYAWETILTQIRLLKDKEKEIEPILMTSLSSFQINPNWLIRLAKAEQVRGAMAMKYQEEILAIHERMYNHRAMVNDEISRSITLELGDQAEYFDPQTGEKRTLISTFNNTWTNGNGIFIQSNDPNFNPNDPSIRQRFNLTGNFRMMRRR